MKTEITSSSKQGALQLRLDPNYKTFIQALKQKVTTTRLRAMLSVNAHQVQLYWDIGQDILERQLQMDWGSKFIEQLAKDMSSSFPDMKGFSRSNMHNMKQFAQAYPNGEFVQQSVGQLPWGHIIALIQKVKDDKVRQWYATQALEEGWARDALIRQIKRGLYEQQGPTSLKTTNFKQRLPAPASDLAQALIKEPYDFGFLPLQSGAKEREIEQGLLEQVKRFLLELGGAFAFVGSQYHLEVGGDDFYIDLLFFNIKLNAYCVVELKTGKFKPEYAGKLNFYISVVDDCVKEPHHAPTIGLLLCEQKNRVVAEYSLHKMENPMGISEYQLSKTVPEQLQSMLPSTELIEDRLSDELGELAVEKTASIKSNSEEI